MHRSAEFAITAEGLRIHAEEFELANHVLGALMVFQRNVDRFAQWRYVGGLPARIAVAQTGTCETVDQLAECGDGIARQPSAIVADVAQAIFDAKREQPMFGLFEALGEFPQPLVGICQRRPATVIPFAALQLLPDFEHLPSLMNDPLCEVLFKFFLVRHVRFPGPLRQCSQRPLWWLNATTYPSFAKMPHRRSGSHYEACFRPAAL